MSWRHLVVVVAVLAISCSPSTPTASSAPSAQASAAASAAPPSASAAASGQAPADVWSLSLDQLKAVTQTQGFDILGHSYFAGPHLVPGSKGMGINTVRVKNGIAYLAGYPNSAFGVLIADVKDPANMKQLAWLPANPGTRTAYLRLNEAKKILVVGYDANAANPVKAEGGAAKGGWAFFDVSDPSKPVKLGEYDVPQGATHGFEIDDRYVYGCASLAQTKKPAGTAQSLSIVDYGDPRAPKLLGTFHVTGQWEGESYATDDQKNPDGTPQIVQCHEVNKDGNTLWLGWRDAGIMALDVADPASPKLLGRYDYVPPYNGGSLGAAHTAAFVPHEGKPRPSFVVANDEIFACPAGIDRVIDVSDPTHMTVLSTIRIAEIDDAYDSASGKFTCPPGQQSSHQPMFPPYGHGSLFFQAWYGQGMRAFDISNPYQPKEVGRFLSPLYVLPPNPNSSPYQDSGLSRHTREVFVDPDTLLVYVTDGNGGGLTVLKYTGPIPERAPIPGTR